MNQPLTQTDWIAHYKAVRSRILKAAIVSPPVTTSEPKSFGLPPPPPIFVLPPPPPEPSPDAQFRAQCREWGIPAMVLDARRICLAACRREKLKWGVFVSPSRKAWVVAPRQRLMYELREGTRLSLPHIGRMLGGRDHTTVLSGIRKHEQRLAAERATNG